MRISNNRDVGVLLWGLVQVLGSIPDLIEGIAKSIRAAEQRREKLGIRDPASGPASGPEDE